MRRNLRLAVAGATLAAVTAGGAGVAAATGLADGFDTPITGAALERASSAALAHTGEGRVTDTEAGDEDSYYEVEVRREDGSQVDVQLDRQFAVVGTEADRAHADSD